MSEELLELQDRYNYLAEKYVEAATRLIPLLEEFGRFKKEMEYITVEFAKYNQEPEEPKELEEKYLQKLNDTIDNR